MPSGEVAARVQTQPEANEALLSVQHVRERPKLRNQDKSYFNVIFKNKN